MDRDIILLIIMESDSRRQGHEIQALHVRHILPKPNQIVNISQQTLKHVYPFHLPTPDPSRTLNLPFPAQYYESRLSNRSKFLPPKSSLPDHFRPSFLIYSKFTDNAHAKTTAMNVFSADRLKSLRQNDFILPKAETLAFQATDSIFEFDSRFQSGNLTLASLVDGVCCLLLHNDVNTTGYTNWFYFSVTSKKDVKGKMAIMNYGKAGWPLNSYPGVCVWSQDQQQWRRHHGNLSCQANRSLYESTPVFDNFNTLYFEYELKTNTKTFFAYNVPYTYTDLLKTLDDYSALKHKHFHRKLAGTTLVGNRIEMITIANFQLMRKMQTQHQVIVILARTHPGETVSSWIVHHLLRFLLSEEPQACALRSAFIFKIFPMVNPDGVIHGNYRCSLIGRDLNRRWKTPSKQLYPQVYFIKNQIVDTHEQKQIKMVLDLHGHTQKRKAFFYGCTDKNAPHRTRLFPYLTTKISNLFDFSSCNFAMERSKQSTARITLYNLIKAPQIFTLQTSQFGMGDKFLSSECFQEIAVTLCTAIAKIFRINGRNGLRDENFSGLGGKEEEKQVDQCEEELMNNANLLKIGCDPSDGSDSEPSVCNLNFDKINKLAMHTLPRPSTENSPKRRVLIRPQSSLRPRSKKDPGLSMGCSRQINQKMSESGFITSFKDKALSPLRAGSSISHKRPNSKTTRPPRIESTISKLKDFTSERRPVRMINFELLINEGSRKSSLRDNFERSDVKLNHTNYQMMQRRWGVGSRGAQWNKTSV